MLSTLQIHDIKSSAIHLQDNLIFLLLSISYCFLSHNQIILIYGHLGIIHFFHLGESVFQNWSNHS